MIDSILLVLFMLVAVPIAIVMCIWWMCRDRRVASRCHEGRHEWSPEVPQGAGGFGLVTHCKHCGAGYIRHRGF